MAFTRCPAAASSSARHWRKPSSARSARRPRLDVEPVALAGYRQAITRDAAGGVERHFVILPFAARWIAGEVALNEELAEAHWRDPSALADLKTTEGLGADR